MKGKLIKTIVICLIISTASVGVYYGYNKFFGKKTVNAANQFIPATAKKMNMQINIQGTGSAYAAVSKDLLPNNNGTLKNLSVKVGDTVKAGDKLFTADSDEVRQNLDKAASSLEKQKLSSANAKSDNDASMQQLSLNDAQNQYNYALKQVDKMTVTAPIGGTVVAVNNSSDDSVQGGKAVLTIVDLSSMKIKVAVDELDIAKVKQGQKAEIKFDAIKDKVYEGTVETVAETGSSSNNVTTYDVTVAIVNPTGIKIGMNANVNILVESKDNVLAIPAEALIERNGKKYVMVAEENTSSSKAGTSSLGQDNKNQNGQNPSSGNGQFAGENPSGNNSRPSGSGSSQNSNGFNGGNSSSSGRQNNGGSTNRQGRNYGNESGTAASVFASNGKLVEIKTGIENENYIEVLEGITEGQKILIMLPQSASSANNSSKNGLSSGFGGGFPGGSMGGERPQGQQGQGQQEQGQDSSSKTK